ncbi:MAG: single-stranded DNA-binding protein [Eubacteriaceae bacterium]|nr:single-stranded DNA-binding protein [Eubacteriaceae bacterium]
MLNKVILIGRLTKDPEVRYTNANTPVASFTLAVNRNFKNKDGNYDADFINIVAWRKLAELCSSSLHKGSLIAITGRIQTSSFEGKDGTRRYTTDVLADEIAFLEKKSAKSYDSADDNALFEKQDNNYGIPVDGFNPIDDDDLPF